MVGYCSSEYAHSLEKFGTPLWLSHSEGWILKRKIPGTDMHDAMGLYPLFCCSNWNSNALHADLKELRDLVSLVVVVGPLQQGGEMKVFSRCQSLKTHYLVDHKTGYEPSAHHRRYIKKAIGDGVGVLIPTNPSVYLPEWIAMYDDLIARHCITGIQAFSSESFEKQFHTPGLVAFVAEHEKEIISMLLFFVHEDRAYYHLGTSSDKGYQLRASFVLMDAAIRELKPRIIVLGGAPGLQDNVESGLARFKAGWSNRMEQSWLYEAVLRPEVYKQLVRGNSSYFPAYRTP